MKSVRACARARIFLLCKLYMSMDVRYNFPSISFLHLFGDKFILKFYIQNFIVNRKWMFSGHIRVYLYKSVLPFPFPLPLPHVVRAFCHILFLFMFIFCESVEKTHLKNEWKKIETSPETEWSHFKSTPSLRVTFVYTCIERYQKGKTYFRTMRECVFVYVFLFCILKSAII